MMTPAAPLIGLSLSPPCKQSRDRIREHYVAMVLGTDMKQHFNNCLVFSTKVSEAKGRARAVSEAGERRSSAGTIGDTEGSTPFGPSSAEPLLNGYHVSGCSAAGRSSAPRLVQLRESTTLVAQLPPPPSPVHQSCTTNSSETPGGVMSASPRRSLQLQRQGVRTKSDMSHDRYRASLLAGSSQLRLTSVTAVTMDRHHSNSSSKGRTPSGGHVDLVISPSLAVDGETTSNGVADIRQQLPAVPAAHTLHGVTRVGTSMLSACPPQQPVDPFLASAIAHLTTDDADRLLVWKVRHDEQVARAFVWMDVLPMRAIRVDDEKLVREKHEPIIPAIPTCCLAALLFPRPSTPTWATWPAQPVWSTCTVNVKPMCSITLCFRLP